MRASYGHGAAVPVHEEARKRQGGKVAWPLLEGAQTKSPRLSPRAFLCGRRDLNSYEETSLPPQSSASTNSATTAKVLEFLTCQEPGEPQEPASREHQEYLLEGLGLEGRPYREALWLHHRFGWLASLLNQRSAVPHASGTPLR